MGWLVTFPADTIKTRIQGSGLLDDARRPHGKPNPYATTWSAIKNSYKDGGVRDLFKGLAPTLVRAIPVNMVTFGVFEAVAAALS
jgi:solute carrier family 25 (mitochondrial carnitine/acylcarnitine transporter), member 20/29